MIGIVPAVSGLLFIGRSQTDATALVKEERSDLQAIDFFTALEREPGSDRQQGLVGPLKVGRRYNRDRPMSAAYLRP